MLDATREQPGGDRIDALMDGIVSTGNMTVEAFDTLQHLIGHFERLVCPHPGSFALSTVSVTFEKSHPHVCPTVFVCGIIIAWCPTPTATT